MITSESAQAKLELLKQEFATGEESLAELLRRENTLRETLLRISGAIQVLQELLEESTSSDLLERDETRLPEPGTVLTVS